MAAIFCKCSRFLSSANSLKDQTSLLPGNTQMWKERKSAGPIWVSNVVQVEIKWRCWEMREIKTSVRGKAMRKRRPNSISFTEGFLFEQNFPMLCSYFTFKRYDDIYVFKTRHVPIVPRPSLVVEKFVSFIWFWYNITTIITSTLCICNRTDKAVKISRILPRN